MLRKRLEQRILLGLLLMSGFGSMRSEVVVTVSVQVGRPGATVDVPISMSGDEAVFGLQFEIGLDPTETADLRPVGVSLGDSELLVRTHTLAPNKHRYLVYSRGSGPIPQGDIASVRLSVPSDISSPEIPIAIDQLDAGPLKEDGSSLSLQGRDGGVEVNFVPEEVKLGGKVQYYSSSLPLEGVSVVGVSGEGEFSTRSDREGSFLLSVPSEQFVEVGVFGSPRDESNRGVTSLDLFLTRRHILGLAPLESAAQQIAADVDRTGDVGALDLLLMRQVILGLAEEFVPGEPLFHYFPVELFSDETLDFGLWNPLRSFESLTDDQNQQDYFGIKLGDVDGDWTAVSGEGVESDPLGVRSLSQAVELSLEAMPDNELPSRRFAIRLANGSRISALQFSVNWDPSEWRFEDLTSAGSTPSGQLEWQRDESQLASGRLGVIWTDVYQQRPSARSEGVMAELILEPLVPRPSAPRVSDDPTLPYAAVGGQSVAVLWPDSMIGETAMRIRQLDSDGRTAPVVVELQSLPNSLYELEAASEIDAQVWESVDVIEGTGGVIRFFDPTANRSIRFYRVRQTDVRNTDLARPRK